VATAEKKKEEIKDEETFDKAVHLVDGAAQATRVSRSAVIPLIELANLLASMHSIDFDDDQNNRIKIRLRNIPSPLQRWADGLPVIYSGSKTAQGFEIDPADPIHMEWNSIKIGLLEGDWHTRPATLARNLIEVVAKTVNLRPRTLTEARRQQLMQNSTVEIPSSAVGRSPTPAERRSASRAQTAPAADANPKEAAAEPAGTQQAEPIEEQIERVISALLPEELSAMGEKLDLSAQEVQEMLQDTDFASLVAEERAKLRGHAVA
jgi:hypothetical protein